MTHQPTLPDRHAAQAHVRAMVKRSHSSFYWAMRLLPPEKRHAMYAIYAFCRIVDDIADEPGALDEKRSRLQNWRREIADIFDGKPTGPVGLELSLAQNRFGLSQTDFLDIIDGMEMDVGEGAGEIQARVRIADLPELELYCDRVAGAVGRLSNRVFGLDRENSDRLAKSLGRALQLTNILRDLSEDASIDRLYLPLDMLKRHGIDETDPLRVLAAPGLPEICAEIAALAESDYQDADALLDSIPSAQVRPAIIMMQTYKRVLSLLIRRGWTNPERPVRLSRPVRLWIVLKCSLFGA